MMRCPLLAQSALALVLAAGACSAERRARELPPSDAAIEVDAAPDATDDDAIANDAAADSAAPSETSETAATGAPDAEADSAPPVEDPALFDPSHLVEAHIDLAPSDWDALRGQSRLLWDILGPSCLAGPAPDPFTWFRADVAIDGHTARDIGLRKKGFLGSLDPVRPALRLVFDQFVPHQTIDGVTDHLTLNNARQDPSRFRQCLAYGVFRAAGVAAPRCNFAHVFVNAEDLGLYAHVEAVRKPFLRAAFGDSAGFGQLWEGQLSDFRDGWRATFQPKLDLPPADPSPLDAVSAALAVPDDQLLAALDAVIDLDGFLTFWATEVLVGHWDGYAANTNNFFVYADPAIGGRLRFIPWGPDGAFMDNAPAPGAAAVFATGALAHRLYLLPEGRARYAAAMRAVLAAAWHEDALDAQLTTWAGWLSGVRGAQPAAEVTADLTQLRQFVAGRRAVIEAELAADPIALPPLRTPPCATPRATITATFETTWGTLGVQNLFTTGTGTLALASEVWPNLQIGRVGAKCGEDELGAPNVAQLVIAAELVNVGYLALLFRIDLDAFAASAPDHALDPHVTEAYAYLIDAQGKSQLLGMLAAGNLHLDANGTGPSSPVKGTVSATLYGVF